MRNGSSAGLDLKDPLLSVDAQYVYWGAHHPGDVIDSSLDAADIAHRTNVTSFPQLTITGTTPDTAQALGRYQGDANADLVARVVSNTVVDTFMDASTLGTGYIIMACWAEAADWATDRDVTVMQYGRASGSDAGVKFAVNSSNKVQATISDVDGADVFIQPSNVQPTGSPDVVHIMLAISLDGTSTTTNIYVDGLFVDADTNAGVAWNAASTNLSGAGFMIGVGVNSGGTEERHIKTNGAVGDAYLFRTDRSITANLPAIATALFNSPYEPPHHLGDLI